MKKLVFISSMLITVLSMSCSSIMSPSDSNPDNTLTGKWRLTETLSDPGDGSGKWQKASSNDMYLIFNSDGTVSGNQAGTLKSYTILDSVHIEFTQMNNNKFTNRYKIASGELILNPQCIEPCGTKYKKVD